MTDPHSIRIHPIRNHDHFVSIEIYDQDSLIDELFVDSCEIALLCSKLEDYLYRGIHNGYRNLLRDRSMTVEEVAKTYRLAAGTVRRSIHKGYINATKSGKNWLILWSDAEKRWGK